MMEIKKHIPNAITSMNLFCGVLATVFALSGKLHVATLLIFSGAIFDFFDGFVARLLHVSSPIGKELDSLADVISFGLAPAAMYSSYVRFALTGSYAFPIPNLSAYGMFWVFAPFILVVFSALRLAKFNLDERQTENFIGLTTTATGLFSASFLWMVVDAPATFDWLRPWLVVFMVVIFSALLVSEVPMFSLKVKNYAWRGNELRYILLAVAVVSVALLGIGGIALTIFAYIVFSLVKCLMA